MYAYRCTHGMTSKPRGHLSYRTKGQEQNVLNIIPRFKDTSLAEF